MKDPIEVCAFLLYCIFYCPSSGSDKGIYIRSLEFGDVFFLLASYILYVLHLIHCNPHLVAGSMLMLKTSIH